MGEARSGERRIVHFQGLVQGVGFRYTTHSLASDHEVTGFVRNLADGRVLLVVEGERQEIDRLLAAIERRMSRYIDLASSDTQPLTGEFVDFHIRQ